MSKTVYDLTNYEDLKAQYEDSQRQLKQTELKSKKKIEFPIKPIMLIEC